MIPALRLAVADALARRALVLGAALLIAAPVAASLLLDGFTRGLDRAFAAAPEGDLVVQESNSVGEVIGSRIPAGLEADLLAMGVPFAIAEIHTVTGTAADTALLLRGIDPERYRSVTRFRVTAGRGIEAGDPDRTAMVGAALAEERRIVPGAALSIRGRDFRVVGIFEVGTYADHEAWVPLDGARRVLGWGDEVSVFVIPAGGPLAEGDTLPGPLSVVRRGDFAAVNREWDPVIGLLRSAALSFAAAGVIVLASVLWRMAWMRRRDLAVLRALGLGRAVPVTFLLVQGLAVAAVGIGAGLASGLAIGTMTHVEAFGITARPEFDAVGILRAVALAASVVAVAGLTAGIGIVRARPADLLRRW